jgi:hypothetical protein
MSYKPNRHERRADAQGAVIDSRGVAAMVGCTLPDVADAIVDGECPPPDTMLPTGLQRWHVESVRHFLAIRGGPPGAVGVAVQPSTGGDDGRLIGAKEVVRRAAALPQDARRLWRPNVLPPARRAVGRVRLWRAVEVDQALGRLREKAERGSQAGARREVEVANA